MHQGRFEFSDSVGGGGFIVIQNSKIKMKNCLKMLFLWIIYFPLGGSLVAER